MTFLQKILTASIFIFMLDLLFTETPLQQKRGENEDRA